MDSTQDDQIVNPVEETEEVVEEAAFEDEADSEVVDEASEEETA